MPARYAVYYAPSAGDALHQAMTPLLGRDALGGLNVPQATPPGVDPVFWKAVTRVPAHYGLHATLKAPFELRHSGMDSQLLRSTGEVASRFLPFAIPSLSLAYLGKEEKGFYGARSLDEMLSAVLSGTRLCDGSGCLPGSPENRGCGPARPSVP